MKVVKVIVDELPQSCYVCDGSDFAEASRMCWYVNEMLDCTRYRQRPEWCPLVKEDQDAVSVIREYVESVQNLISEIISACTYQDEPTAASGRYELPMRCFTDMERLSELSHEIYDSILEEK